MERKANPDSRARKASEDMSERKGLGANKGFRASAEKLARQARGENEAQSVRKGRKANTARPARKGGPGNLVRRAK